MSSTIPTRPKRNPHCSNTKRQRHFNKKVTEEKAQAEDVRIGTEPNNKKEWIANYLENKRLSDHITREMINQIFGKRLGIPTSPAEKHIARLGKDTISGILGKIQDESGAISISRELHLDTETGDLDWVFYNARKVDDLTQRLNRDTGYEETMETRNEDRTTIAKKPWDVRKKIRKQERSQGLKRRQKKQTDDENAKRGIF